MFTSVLLQHAASKGPLRCVTGAVHLVLQVHLQCKQNGAQLLHTPSRASAALYRCASAHQAHGSSSPTTGATFNLPPVVPQGWTRRHQYHAQQGDVELSQTLYQHSRSLSSSIAHNISAADRPWLAAAGYASVAAAGAGRTCHDDELLQLLLSRGVPLPVAQNALRSAYVWQNRLGTSCVHMSVANWSRWFDWLETKVKSVGKVISRNSSFLMLHLDQKRKMQMDNTLQAMTCLLEVGPEVIERILYTQPTVLNVTPTSMKSTIEYLLNDVGVKRQQLSTSTHAYPLLACTKEILQAKVDWLRLQGFDKADINTMVPSLGSSLKTLKRKVAFLSLYTKSKATAVACLKRRPTLVRKKLEGKLMQAKFKYWEEKLHPYHGSLTNIAHILQCGLVTRTAPRYAMMTALGTSMPAMVTAWLSSSPIDFMRRLASNFVAQHGILAKKGTNGRQDVAASMLKVLLSHPDYTQTVHTMIQQGDAELAVAQTAAQIAPAEAYQLWVRVWQASPEGQRWTALSAGADCDDTHEHNGLIVDGAA